MTMVAQDEYACVRVSVDKFPDKPINYLVVVQDRAL